MTKKEFVDKNTPYKAWEDCTGVFLKTFDTIYKKVCIIQTITGTHQVVASFREDYAKAIIQEYQAALGLYYDSYFDFNTEKDGILDQHKQCSIHTYAILRVQPIIMDWEKLLQLLNQKLITNEQVDVFRILMPESMFLTLIALVILNASNEYKLFKNLSAVPKAYWTQWYQLLSVIKAKIEKGEQEIDRNFPFLAFAHIYYWWEQYLLVSENDENKKLFLHLISKETKK